MRPQTTMRAVLGIDAAWTVSQPSGVALAIEAADGWRLQAVAASYSQFCALSDGKVGDTRARGAAPDPAALLAAAAKLGKGPVDLVAVDMPLSRSPIVGRRVSDQAISYAYGSRGASTHSPDVNRPGPISDDLRTGFAAEGYYLQTEGTVVGGLVEVYPHPALIEFAKAQRRLHYKYGKRAKYWPGELSIVRKSNILREWRAIASLMENEMAGVEGALPELDRHKSSGADWKAYEDILDAIVCVAVGISVLQGSAVPFGDKTSAIWVPQPGSGRPRRFSSETIVDEKGLD